MRREVVRAAVTSAWIALAVLALPLGVAIHLLLLGGERNELERAALRAAALVGPALNSGTAIELPRPEADSQLGVYDATGRLRSGTGPANADLATLTALRGQVGQGSVSGDLVTAVPVLGDRTVAGTVRAASPMAAVWQRSSIAWTVLLGLVAAAQLAAVAVARRRADRLAAPLEQLAAASRAIGEGDFTIQVPPCGIAEIDRVAAIQNATARRLGDLLQRERQFSANASHQLRTPLTGLQLGLESACNDPGADQPAALREALAATRRLQATVEDVLALHRQSTPEAGGHGEQRQRLEEIIDDAAGRWHGRFAAAGRRLTLDTAPMIQDAALPAVRVGQILDVLLDNALRHGAGQVRVSTRAAGPAVGLEVSDEGSGIPPSAGDVFRRGTGTDHGIGLSLARDFAQSLGGRLFLAARTPPVFTLLVPVGLGDAPADAPPEPVPDHADRMQ